MNDAGLSRYFWLMKDIESIKKDLENMEIEYIDLDNQDAVTERKILLQEKLKNAAEEVLTLERYLDEIEDVEIQHLLRLRYVSRMTWEAIGECIYMSPSGALRKCMRFLKSEENKKALMK